MDAATRRIGIQRLKNEVDLSSTIDIDLVEPKCSECECTILHSICIDLEDLLNKDVDWFLGHLLDEIEEAGHEVTRAANGSVKFICEDCALNEE